MKSYDVAVNWLKVGVCFILFKDLISFFVYRDLLFGDAGIVPLPVYHKILSHFGLEFFQNFFSGDYLIWLCLAALLLNILFFLNVNNLLVGSLLYLVLVLFRLRNIYIMDGHDNLIAFMVLYLALYKNTYLVVKPAVIVFLVKFQLCMVYFFSGLWKVDGALWQNGTALYYVLNTEDFNVYQITSLLNGFPLIFIFLTYFTLVFEIAFPFLVWINRFRLPLLVAGLLLHLGIFVLMRIDGFSLTMILCYVVLLTDQEIAQVKAYLMRKAGFMVHPQTAA